MSYYFVCYLFLSIQCYVDCKSSSSYGYSETKPLQNGGYVKVRALAFKKWENKAPLEDNTASHVTRSIVNATTTIDTPSVCGKHCMRTPLCCGFYFKQHDYCKLVNQSRSPFFSQDELGIDYYEILSECTKNGSLCGQGGECVPDFKMNTYECHYLIPIHKALKKKLEDVKVMSSLKILYHTDTIKTAAFIENVNIKKGTTIKSARMLLKLNEDAVNVDYDIKIAAQKKPNANIPDSSSFLTELTNNITLWKPPHQDAKKNDIIYSGDFKEVIQEIVDQSDWVQGNKVLIYFYNDELSTHYNGLEDQRYHVDGVKSVLQIIT